PTAGPVVLAETRVLPVLGARISQWWWFSRVGWRSLARRSRSWRRTRQPAVVRPAGRRSRPFFGAQHLHCKPRAERPADLEDDHGFVTQVTRTCPADLS